MTILKVRLNSFILVLNSLSLLHSYEKDGLNMLRKSLILTALGFLLLMGQARGQSSEFGVTLGAANFWGDLGGSNKIGRPLFFDLELSLTRPVLGFTYRNNINGYRAIRLNLFYAQVEGSDELIKVSDIGSDEAYRRYRNLKFKSMILELSAQLEINLMRFEVGRRRYRFAPYIFFGAGGFYFNPKDPDSNTELRPLRLEGQGSAEYPDRKEYSLLQVAALFGTGIKYNISENWTIGFEYGHRITWTDYIDDVSKTYVDPAVFYNNLSPGEAATAEVLARRSVELDPNDFYPWMNLSTQPGQQRGDPADNDHYVFAGLVTLTYTMARGKIYCPKFN
jgi:opacity protein-like surface antigen